MNQLLLLLILIPVSTYYLSQRKNPHLTWRLTGIAFGLVVAPISLCLAKYLYVPLIGKLISLFGLGLNLIHGSVGYFMVVSMGLLEPGTPLSAAELILINAVNGVIWSAYYGFVGFNLDVKWAHAEAGEEVPQGYHREKIVS